MLWSVILLSLQVSGLALLFAAFIGVPFGAWLALTRFRGRSLVLAVLYTCMGLPPVVVGLMVYLLLSQTGPFAQLQWLFTTNAMVMAQTAISTPIVAGTVMAAVSGVEPDLRRQLLSLGATPLRAMWDVIFEARFGVLLALVAGFGRNISEVGAVMLVGGNIEGFTRVLTTAIVLETRQGKFDLAVSLGLVLLGVSFLVNGLLLVLQTRTNGVWRAV
ncbi:MAG: ABC transporter permease [Chloroflexota bacterium]|nr:ABC transporter permease [Chloroflexota bacterium]